MDRVISHSIDVQGAAVKLLLNHKLPVSRHLMTCQLSNLDCELWTCHNVTRHTVIANSVLTLDVTSGRILNALDNATCHGRNPLTQVSTHQTTSQSTIASAELARHSQGSNSGSHKAQIPTAEPGMYAKPLFSMS
jgi:hypothetical protein